MDLEKLSRKELQTLAKQNGLKANQKNAQLIEELNNILNTIKPNDKLNASRLSINDNKITTPKITTPKDKTTKKDDTIKYTETKRALKSISPKISPLRFSITSNKVKSIEKSTRTSNASRKSASKDNLDDIKDEIMAELNKRVEKKRANDKVDLPALELVSKKAKIGNVATPSKVPNFTEIHKKNEGNKLSIADHHVNKTNRKLHLLNTPKSVANNILEMKKTPIVKILPKIAPSKVLPKNTPSKVSSKPAESSAKKFQKPPKFNLEASLAKKPTWQMKTGSINKISTNNKLETPNPVRQVEFKALKFSSKAEKVSKIINKHRLNREDAIDKKRKSYK